MNSLLLWIRSFTQHYDHNKYWSMRNKLTSGKGTKLHRMLWLYRIKRMDAFNCASLGTHLEKSANFESVPNFPHGLYGIDVPDNSTVVLPKPKIIVRHNND